MVFFCTILQFFGTIDITQFFGFTVGKVSPENAEGIDSTVFVLITVVAVVIACSVGFPSYSSISFLLSLVSILGCRSKTRFVFRNAFSMLFECLINLNCL